MKHSDGMLSRMAWNEKPTYGDVEAAATEMSVEHMILRVSFCMMVIGIKDEAGGVVCFGRDDYHLSIYHIHVLWASPRRALAQRQSAHSAVTFSSSNMPAYLPQYRQH